MAAPEERDLTQEQTEKLLQFQVAASTRCSKCRHGLGSGPLEEPRTLLRLGPRFFSDQRQPPPPQTPTALLLPAPEPLSVLGLPARVAALSSPLSGSASLVSLSGTRPQPFFPVRLPVGLSPPFDSRSTEMLNPHRGAGLVSGLWKTYQHPMLFLQIFTDGLLGSWSCIGRSCGGGGRPGPHPKGVGGHHIRKQCNSYECHQWLLTGFFHPGPIPGLTFLTVLEVGGNLQKSASF